MIHRGLRTLQKHNIARLLLMVVLTLSTAKMVNAADVVAQSRQDIQLRADYQAGKAGKEAVLLLHGFLATQEFPLLRKLSQGLAAQGFSVLTPTLTLGMNGRTQVLPCDALHLHSFEQDLQEIGFWVEWLLGRGHQKVVLIGHSFGAVQLAAYLQGKASSAIEHLIMISPPDLEYLNLVEPEINLGELRKKASLDQEEILELPLLYCWSFPAPASIQYSYRQWHGAQFLATLGRLRQPVRAMLGGADRRLPPGWAAALVKVGVEVQIIPEAEHFFREMHERALLEKILAAMEIEN